MDFKKYDEIIKEHKFDMLHFIIYYNLKCNNIFLESEEFKHDEYINVIISTIYDAYIKDESHLDLSFICDTALEYKDKILNDENFGKWELLNLCYNSIK